MRKLALALCLLSVLSCSKDETDPYAADPYYESINGRYKLAEMYSDSPVDLNFDGNASTDMFIEMQCFFIRPIELYTADFQYHEPVSYDPDVRLDLSFNVANSEVISEEQPYEQCFNLQQLMYIGIAVDKETGSISISESDNYEDEFNSFASGYYSNKKFYLTVNKNLFTENGWQAIPIHFVYEWRSL